MTAPAAVRRAAYIVTESRISIAVNAVLSLVFFLVFIGLPTPVLVPGLLTAAGIRAGRIAGSAGAGGGIVLPALPLVPALIAKISYGATLTRGVTPIGLRRALRSTELA